MRYLYSLLFYLIQPLVLLRLWWRGRKAPDYRHRWAERFGFFPALQQPGCLWVHAVSMGETRAALPLIRELLQRYPDRAVLVTTTTPTGSRQVRDALGEQVHHVYAPYDLPDVVNRFLNRTRPSLVLIMETELWPNWFHQCRSRNIPVVLANARLSERSAQGYARLPRLIAEALNGVEIAVRSEIEAQRFRELGATRVQVTGNIKYDLKLPEGLAQQAQELGLKKRPVWIAASTHAGEDEPILDAYAQLRKRWPELLLLLVPRHPERFDEVAQLCRTRGWRVLRRSEKQACSRETDVFLGDTMGELLLFYAAVRGVAFVGGSLVPVGGHNVLEPALLGLPVLFGLHMFNFSKEARLLLAAEAAWQVQDVQGMVQIMTELLADLEQIYEAGQRGRVVVEDNRGALAALLKIIQEVL